MTGVGLEEWIGICYIQEPEGKSKAKYKSMWKCSELWDKMECNGVRGAGRFQTETGIRQSYVLYISLKTWTWTLLYKAWKAK